MKQTVNKTVNLNLVGVNGNAHFIMAMFKRQARIEGWTEAEIEMVLSEATSKDYDYLLSTIANHCEVKE